MQNQPVDELGRPISRIGDLIVTITPVLDTAALDQIVAEITTRIRDAVHDGVAAAQQ